MHLTANDLTVLEVFVWALTIGNIFWFIVSRWLTRDTRRWLRAMHDIQEVNEMVAMKRDNL